jgi:hypothetical protein
MHESNKIRYWKSNFDSGTDAWVLLTGTLYTTDAIIVSFEENGPNHLLFLLKYRVLTPDEYRDEIVAYYRDRGVTI